MHEAGKRRPSIKFFVGRWWLLPPRSPIQIAKQLILGKALLAAARKLTASREMLLWMTPSEAPKALQASECSELLDPMRASCGIFAQH